MSKVTIKILYNYKTTTLSTTYNISFYLPWPLVVKVWNAKIGLLRGNETLPVDKTATAGRATFNVAPIGYTKQTALKTINKY